ncbi:hypothetical protein [Natrinema sp. 1APR25-10V2]|uniref:hypothetical protein n=1 Tax=Natrinema sp. 1APR25-10V2 TaxID=2951081 RepID=UPI002876149E|nr:hypothetical protein [Natrinema sp. 1APR25-10V2]MDS0477202.1 hypothetical protein [Natrinema sp. 1APR25-10V2]
MPGGLDPTEEYDGSVTVRLLDDSSGTREIQCSSFCAAIETVEEHQYSVTVAKIIDRDDNVVFTSADMDIDDWKTEWEHAKRSLSVDVDEYDCPYDDIACFADNLCVQCKMDKVQSQYRA